jgi:hypothetical protein
MIEINLIPDVKQELLKAQRARTIVISSSIFASIVAVGVVVLLLVYLFGVQGIRSAVLDGQITDKNEKLSSVQDLSKILTIQNQLKSIDELNSKKNMDSRVFDLVSAITPQVSGNPTVAFTQINIGTEATATEEEATTQKGGGQLHLEGQTSGYDSMEVFKKTIANSLFEYTVDGETKTLPVADNISTTDISYGKDSEDKKVLRFTISFDYPAELLSPKSTQIKFKQNIKGNVTDSYLGIPRFTERAKDIEGGQ